MVKRTFLEAVNQLKKTSDCIKIDPPGPGRNLKKNSKKVQKSDQNFGSQKSKKSSKIWSKKIGGFFFRRTYVYEKMCFYVKNPQKFWITFFNIFLTFFQIPSRTSGINFDTIACVFELVDGQKMSLSFFVFNFFSDFFQNISWPLLGVGNEWIGPKKYFEKTIF